MEEPGVGDSMVPLVFGLSAHRDQVAEEMSVVLVLVTTPMIPIAPIALRNLAIPMTTPQVELLRSSQAPRHRHRHHAIQALPLQIVRPSVPRQPAPHLSLALPHATLLSQDVVLQGRPKPQPL